MDGNASNSFRASDGRYYRKRHELVAKYHEKCEKTLLRHSEITQKLNSNLHLTCGECSMDIKMESDNVVHQENDLPLLANVDDIRVQHYMLNLSCDFQKKCFSGLMLVFLQPTQSKKSGDISQVDCSNVELFECILDSCDIIVHKVEEVVHSEAELDEIVSSHEKRQYEESMDEWATKLRNPLCHSVEEWCVKIWKPNVTSKIHFPRVVALSYSTMSKGASLHWRLDQDGNECVFTPAAWINNRSLLACQEPPVAMATWQAKVTVPRGYVVLMTGDKNPNVTECDSCLNVFYYFTVMLLPISTLAIAVGKWWYADIHDGVSELSVPANEVADVVRTRLEEICHSLDTTLCCRHDSYPCYLQKREAKKVIPCRLFAPLSILNQAKIEFKVYLRACLEAAYNLLGPHPFERLDILVVPRSFAHLGLASPNLVFISQTVVAGDGTMCIRLSHEISHSWFGLLIGALDWAEEWLSEGFATYIEDLIHSAAMKIVLSMSKKCKRGRCCHEYCHHKANGKKIRWSDVAELRACLRYKILKAEMQNTDNDLQILIPCDKSSSDSTKAFVKNGMNPLKSFMQVHYLKGYFLLRYMAYFVGSDNFVRMLRQYAFKYHGQLVHSSDFLHFYSDYFRETISHLDMDEVFRVWLETPGIPSSLGFFCTPSQKNLLYYEVKYHYYVWQQVNFLPKNKFKLGSESKIKTLPQLISDQLALLLELLLALPKLSASCVNALILHYQPEQKNADVRHRMCELIVRYGHKASLPMVSNFLQDDQGMGVYLYGELLIRGGPFSDIARRNFDKLKDEMDPSSRVVVEDMINGS